MTTVYAAGGGELLVARGDGAQWRVESHLEGASPQCLAIVPPAPERVWCGTWGQGLWRSDDAGESWRVTGAEVTRSQVTAVAVTAAERSGQDGVVYAGTEPSALFRSEDGGNSWEEMAGMLALPSAATWSFPPRPQTSHVRWIALDPEQAGAIYVCIEAGALVRSFDAGRTWVDRVSDGPYDTHTLVTHPRAPGRLYSAAGDGFGAPGRGYNQSPDRGESWDHPDEGIDRQYLWSIAVDPADPDTMIVSAASSPFTAHDPTHADATIYRRSQNQAWQEVSLGLPPTKGTTRAVLAANPAEAGVFYAASNRGIYRSADTGLTWERLPIAWPYDNSPQAVLVA
jgi:hypothetical protein